MNTWNAPTAVLDDDYPLNLRTIYNLPPFLFYLGDLRADDAYSVAVVGTREPSSNGLRRARRMADGLARSGVTVLSGLQAVYAAHGVSPTWPLPYPVEPVETPPTLSYRAARDEDVPVMGEVVRSAYNALSRQHGFPELLVRPPSTFQAFSIRHEPEGCWIAEDSGRVVGIAIS